MSYTRLRLGVVKTAAWRATILQEGTGYCLRGCNPVDPLDQDGLDDLNDSLQPLARDTFEHILFECEYLNAHRANGRRNIEKLGGSWELPSLMKSRASMRVVQHFLRECGLNSLLQ